MVEGMHFCFCLHDSLQHFSVSRNKNPKLLQEQVIRVRKEEEEPTI